MKIANKVNVLGSEYAIECRKISEDQFLSERNWCGYCDYDEKLIVYADCNEEKYFPNLTVKAKEFTSKQTLRHEITHAFLNESGLRNSSLQYSSGWAVNEEMVDWIASQFPKMLKAFTEVGCI